MFLKTDFDEIIIAFPNENGRPLEIEDKVYLILLINKKKRHVILENQEQEYMAKIWIFVIHEVSVQQIWEKSIAYCH